MADLTPGRLLEPHPRYTRLVKRYDCPICKQPLGQQFTNYDGSTSEQVRIYTDTQHRDVTVRVFHPCGCDDIIPLGHGKGA